MKITPKMILDKNPCPKWTEERIKKYLGDGMDVLDALNIEDVSVSDKIWVAVGFLPDKINYQFAIWCARQCKAGIKEITDYIDVAEKYYIYGTATKRELKVARDVAHCAADTAPDWVADWAAYMAPDMAADMVADMMADWVAVWAANTVAMRKKQLAKLKELVTLTLLKGGK